MYKETIGVIPIVSGKPSGKICPVCHQAGSFLSHRCTKYNINIPKRNRIKTISDAWDYGAHVCLRLAENLMLYPTADSISDSIASCTYDFWGRLAFHNDDEIQFFEAKLLKVIPKSLQFRTKYLTSKYNRSKQFDDGTKKQVRDPIHISLPKKRVVATRASVSLVFAACICLVLKDLFAPRTSVADFPMVRGIYTYFTILQRQLNGVDFRTAGKWADLFWNARNVENLGYYRASRLARQVTNLCRACKQNKKEFSEMTREDDGISLKCPNCGGTDPIVRHYSIPYLKQKQSAIVEKANDIVESIPRFVKSLDSLAVYLKSDPVRGEFMRLFREYESLAENGVFVQREVSGSTMIKTVNPK